jgi:hypothetical protein
MPVLNLILDSIPAPVIISKLILELIPKLIS